MDLQRADVLGRLLVIQEALEAMPDEAAVASFLRRALHEVPGVADAHLCVRGVLYPPDERLKDACARFGGAPEVAPCVGSRDFGDIPGIALLPLATALRIYGFLALSVDDPKAFSAYEGFLRNTANIVANVLEKRDQVERITHVNEELAGMKRGLEARILERTAELSQRNAELTEEIKQRKLTEQALLESQGKFRSLVETSSDWIWETDENDIYTFSSPRSKALLGYEPEEIIGKSAFDFMSPAEAARVAEIVQAIAAERKPIISLENANLHKDGREVILETSAVPIIDDHGAFRGYRGIDRDITERKRGIDALRESEERFRAMSTAALDAMITIDDLGRIAFWNEAASRIFGYAAEDALGQDAHLLLAPARYLVDYRAGWPRFAKDGEGPVIGKVLNVDARRKDGAEFPIELSISAVKFRGHWRAMGIVRDVTERKRAGDALKRASLYTRSLIEASLDPLVTISPKGAITDVNEATVRATGVARAKLIGSDFCDYFTEPERARAGYQEVFAKGFVRDYPLAIRDATGKITEVLYNASVYRDDKGEVSGVFAAARDITERKRAEEALRKSEASLKLQFDRMPLGCITWSADFRVVAWNPAAEKIFGFTASEALGKHPYDFIVPKSAQPQVDVIWARLLEGDTTARSVNENQTKDGRTIMCDWTNTPLRLADGRVVGVLAMVEDITLRVRAERALARTERALKALSNCNATLVHADDEGQLLKDMCRVIAETEGYEMAAISFAEHDEAKTVRPVAWAGNEAGFLAAARITWADTERGQGPTGTAIRTGEPQVDQNVATNPKMVPWRQQALERGFASSAALPLKINAGVIGALTIYAAEPDAFDSDELSLLVELAEDLSYGISNLRIRAARETIAQQLHKSMESTIGALASMIELRDPYTAGHQRNVSLLAAAIARDLGLPEQDIEGIRLAGVVHDVGKIQVPAEILSKPGRLTKAEFELIKAHAQAGYDIIKGVDFPWPVASTILQHHERLDGSGYPNGLKGDDILVSAKIIAVADVVEAMMARRPYREALGLDLALAEIEAGKGTRYDPAAVDACRALFRENRFNFP